MFVWGVPSTVITVDGTGLWLAIASTLAMVGAGWQVVLAFLDGIESMDAFLGAKNALMREERGRIRESFSRWRLLRRRNELGKVEALAREAMTERERRLERRFDRQGMAWAFVMVGAMMATAVSWIAVAAG